MASEWYYLKDDEDEQQGPVSSEQLKKMAASGQLAPNDLVWKEGMADWQDASKVKGLFPSSEPAAAAKAPPPPAPAKAPPPPAPAPTRTPAPAPARAAPPPSAPAPAPANPYSDLPQDDPFGDALAMSGGMQSGMTPIPQGAAYGQAPMGQVPMGQPPMQPAMPQSMGGPHMSSAYRVKRPFRPKVKPQVWGIFLCIAAGLMILSFVSPWWGARFYFPSEEEAKAMMEEKMDEMSERLEDAKNMTDEERRRMLEKNEREREEEREKLKSYKKFYEKYDIADEDSDFDPTEMKEGDSKIWLVWGWQTGYGVVGLVLGLLLLPAAIVFGFVKPLQPWSWIMLFISIAAGVVMIMAFPAWFFGTPDENQLPVLRQGVIAGPWMALVSGIAVVVCGLTGGIMGLIAFIKS